MVEVKKMIKPINLVKYDFKANKSPGKSLFITT